MLQNFGFDIDHVARKAHFDMDHSLRKAHYDMDRDSGIAAFDMILIFEKSTLICTMIQG